MPLISQGFRIEAPERWPLLQLAHHRTRYGAFARVVGRGVECVPAPTWPEGPKEGSRRPARRVPLGGQPTTGGSSAGPPSAHRCAALLHGQRPAPARRAPRAFKDVEIVITKSGNIRCRRRAHGRFRWPGGESDSVAGL